MPSELADGQNVATDFFIDGRTGGIRLGCVTLEPLARRSTIEPLVAHLVKKSRDMKTGYEWLDLEDVTFGGQPASLSLCFHNGRFDQAMWSMHLPGALMEDGYPTRAAIDAEVAFVRSVLARDIGFDPQSTYPTEFPWGRVASIYDDRSSMVLNGVVYEAV